MSSAAQAYSSWLKPRPATKIQALRISPVLNCTHSIGSPACRYDTRFDLHVDDAAAGALFAVVSSYTPAMEGMPAVVNFNFPPDMGRMTA